jgi:hypothetical protein
MAKENIRQVKLQSKYRPIRSGWINNNEREIPWLTLSGLWLERAGFRKGDRLEITVENNLLTIKKTVADGDQND